ncbi:MAG: GGDEF domain-containing protein [Gemmatimonadota bacterium]|nr:GGDEF domain-containing protein [Gemmatimonadota bacterium]
MSTAESSAPRHPVPARQGWVARARAAIAELDEQSLLNSLSPALHAGATAQLARERAGRIAAIGWVALPLMLLVLRIDIERILSGEMFRVTAFPLFALSHLLIVASSVPAIRLSIRRRRDPDDAAPILQLLSVSLVLLGLTLGAGLAMTQGLSSAVDGRGRVQFTLAMIIANLLYQLSGRQRVGFSLIAMLVAVLVLSAQRTSDPAFVSARITETLIITLIMVLAGGSVQWQRLRSIVVEQRLAELTITDGLTGLASRNRVEQELGDALTAGRPVSVLLLDVDRFKAINDNYGHNTGDDVLRLLAKVLQQRGRARDLVGRWGGEEFVIVCEGTPLAGAVSLADHLRQRIAAQEFPAVGQCTASFGVAESTPGDTLVTLIDRADQALYAAKRDGRNRVVESIAPHLLRAGGRDVLERSTDTPRSSPITLVS